MSGKPIMRSTYIFTLLLATLLFSGCRPAAAPISIGNQAISINDVPQPGVPLKPVEKMSWTGFDGNDQKLGDLRGKVVVLDFWATYCKPCLEEIPHLNALQAKYGSDLQIIGMHVGGEEDQPKVPEFKERLKIAYPLAYPEDALTRYIFGNESAIPQTAIFDREGQLVRKIIGFDDKIKVQLDDAIEKAVKAGS